MPKYAAGPWAVVVVLLSGCTSREERIRARLDALPTPEEIMARRDDDGDGRLTLEEFKDGARRNPETAFANADADTDGYLTLQELRAQADAIRARLRDAQVPDNQLRDNQFRDNQFRDNQLRDSQLRD